MAKICIELTEPLRNGMTVKFRAPCDCTEVTGLDVTFPADGGLIFTTPMTLMDAHGNRLAGVGNLFMQYALVSVLLDTENKIAYIQNADTNGYLEGEFAKLRSLHVDDGTGCFYRMVGEEQEWINPPMVVGTEYRTTERFNGKPIYTALVQKVVTSYANARVFAPPNGIVDLVLGWNGFTSTGYTLPQVAHDSNAQAHRGVSVHKTQTGISVTTTAGENVVSLGETWYVQLWYTKE